MTALRLAWTLSPMTENPSARRGFTADDTRAEMRRHLKLIVGLAPETHRQRALEWTARHLGLEYGVAKRLFYGEIRRIEAHIADRVRACVTSLETIFEQKAKLEADIRKLGSVAPHLAKLSPPALPDLEAPSTPITRKRA